MLDLKLPPSRAQPLEWPEHCAVSPRVRKEIEAAHAQPQQQCAELAQLRAVIAGLQREVQELRAGLAKFRSAYKSHHQESRRCRRRPEPYDVRRARKLAKTKDELAGFTPNIVRLIRGHACTKEIGARLAELEKRPVYEWKGPFVEGTEHSPGHLVQRGGNVWLCTATTTGVPGKCEDFSLLVRSGRDGRDLTREQREPVVR